MLLLANHGSSVGGVDLEPKHAGTPPGAFQGVDELAEMDDWGSAWQDAKDKGEAWGGRGKGGRGVQRNTWQPKDVYVEGKEACVVLTRVRSGSSAVGAVYSKQYPTDVQESLIFWPDWDS